MTVRGKVLVTEPNRYAMPNIDELALLIMAVREAEIELGEDVAVVGSAMEARVAAQLAGLAGALQIARLEPDQAKDEAPQTADVLIYASDDGRSLPPCLPLVRDGGRVLLLGKGLGAVDLDLYPDLHRRSICLFHPPAAPATRQITDFAAYLLASGCISTCEVSQ